VRGGWAKGHTGNPQNERGDDRATKADGKLFHAWLGLGRMLTQANHPDEAIKALEVATTLDRSNSAAMYEMGRAFYGVRNQGPQYKKTGTQWFESALKASPALAADVKADAYWRLGDLYFDLNKPGETARAWESATALAEDIEKNTGKAPTWLTMTWYRLGQVHEGMNNRVAQKRAWTRFVSRNPPDGSEKSAATYWLATTGKNF